MTKLYELYNFILYTWSMNKILLIDKPADWTSFDVVAKIRGAARAATGNKKIKVGHAGTLDPFATGLLIVLIDKETKNQDNYMKQDKEYLATLKLGETSTTGDPEGIIEEFSISNSQFSIPDIEEVFKQFLGEISQIPPIYSAIKVDGKRAYDLARTGENPVMKPRNVTIHSLRIDNYTYPELKIVVSCSSGTYIRTLAEDIGKALGTGAYLTALRRTKIGDFDVKDALTVEEAVSTLS
jgi:tRNA pseudouridine55 synthase